MIKVGVIGCGKIAERASLPNLVNYKEKCQVTYLCDIVKEKAEDLVKKFELSNAKITTDWKELVKSTEVDVVFVDTPNYLHEEMTVEAAKNKKHVLVEKPITISIEAADNMVKAAKDNGVFLMVEQTQRFDPVHQAARKVLDSGILGKIHNIRGRIGHAGPEYWSEGKAQWFYDKKKSGGGAMIDIGVHISDLLRWFSGKKVVEVCAKMHTLEKELDIEDNATVLMQFDDGTKGEFECSWTTRPYEVLTYVYGEKGKMITAIGADKPIAVYLVDTGEGKDPNNTLEEQIPELGTGNGWENAVHYFIDCVQNNEPPFVSGEEGKETLKLILAAFKSNETGQWVKV